MARDLIQKNVTLSADVRLAIADDVEERGISANDVIVGILAANYRVRFDGTGRRSRGVEKPGDRMVNLKVPAALAAKLDAAKSRQPQGQRTLQEVIEPILRAHYGDRVPAAATAA